jgi:hypothetical protein
MNQAQAATCRDPRRRARRRRRVLNHRHPGAFPFRTAARSMAPCTGRRKDTDQEFLTDPQALTVSEAAALISEATGQTITHLELDRDAWIADAIANGVPAEYEAALRPLTETVESGNGSHPNGMAEQITGTPLRTFRDLARKNAAAWSEAAS